MKRIYTYTILLFYLCLFLESSAQYNPRNVCRIENNKTIFKLDRRWTEKQRKEIRKLFDLDSLLLVAAYRGAREIVLDGVKWQIKNIDKNQVEISKDININPVQQISSKDIFIFDDLINNITNIKTQESATFGVNNFKESKAFEYKNNTVHLFLRDYPKAKKIYLSGTFNNWNTMKLPMRQTPYGWMVNIKLPPGKYLYKYIIDGKWTDDPNNRLREEDMNGGKNSVFYCPNYQFVLKNFKDAKGVILAGSFNDWKTNQLEMNKTTDGWALPVYLKDGTYGYKFIVNGNWITDPANKNTRTDGGGNINSVLGIGQSSLFQLNGFTTAKHVFLSGTFNNWTPDELPMEKTPQGWKLAYILAAGNYEYKFVVDGNWMTDPANPYAVGQGNLKNSFIALRPNHIFQLDKYLSAKKVFISGDFVDWSDDEYQMIKKDGKWQFPLYLSPGKHTYKFVVDGNWILDPLNKLWEPNQYSTNNSVVWIGL